MTEMRIGLNFSPTDKNTLLKDYKKTIEDISNRKDITTISYAETSFDDLIEYIVIFILIFLFLSGEWFLRRWYGSY